MVPRQNDVLRSGVALRDATAQENYSVVLGQKYQFSATSQYYVQFSTFVNLDFKI